MYRYTHVHTHRHMYMQTQTHTNTHTDTCTYTHTPIKSCSTSYLHSQSRVLHSRGRLRAQHTLLPLLSLCSTIEQSDGSQCE
ncbi:unnamed protein product [Staurois parvus]|uniref:Uncharacterized protein n=1 Tax=Staurois parvus TaxID=386267 RepID=A0ABN9BMT1_9NEOB|nr:unnamed protein product [Staurois parvus]